LENFGMLSAVPQRLHPLALALLAALVGAEAVHLFAWYYGSTLLGGGYADAMLGNPTKHFFVRYPRDCPPPQRWPTARLAAVW
jgi:hypothetical protein